MDDSAPYPISIPSDDNNGHRSGGDGGVFGGDGDHFSCESEDEHPRLPPRTPPPTPPGRGALTCSAAAAYLAAIWEHPTRRSRTLKALCGIMAVLFCLRSARSFIFARVGGGVANPKGVVATAALATEYSGIANSNNGKCPSIPDDALFTPDHVNNDDDASTFAATSGPNASAANESQSQSQSQSHPALPVHYLVRPLDPNTHVSASKISCHTIGQRNVYMKACAYQNNHFGLFRDHLRREMAVYQLVMRVFKLRTSGDAPPGPAQVTAPGDVEKAFVDVGANHGLMSIFAARIGADTVFAVEPNKKLAQLVAHTLRINSASEKSFVFNAACVDGLAGRIERVRLRNEQVAEGAVGSVVRGVGGAVASSRFRIPAAPLSAFLPPGGGVVGMIKVDVEGHELGVLRSLASMLEAGGAHGGGSNRGARVAWDVENIVVEYGPPSRWQHATQGNDGPNEAAQVLARLRALGYAVRILPSFAYGPFRKEKATVAAKRVSHQSGAFMGIPVENDWSVIDVMQACDCEAYLWLFRPREAKSLDAVYTVGTPLLTVWRWFSTKAVEWVFWSLGWLFVACTIVFAVQVCCCGLGRDDDDDDDFMYATDTEDSDDSKDDDDDDDWDYERDTLARKSQHKRSRKRDNQKKRERKRERKRKKKRKLRRGLFMDRSGKMWRTARG